MENGQAHPPGCLQHRPDHVADDTMRLGYPVRRFTRAAVTRLDGIWTVTLPKVPTVDEDETHLAEASVELLDLRARIPRHGHARTIERTESVIVQGQSHVCQLQPMAWVETTILSK